ncbi:MAG: histidinol-phosphate aminotransferase [Frankiaceae bacterium]|nr:histidinol-phosphate aminotransferase [Frankiaceae bacterium]
MTLPVRDDLRGAVPYGAPQLDVAVRLNTNENPYSPPPEVLADLGAALAEAAATLNRYPDREALALRTDLAAYLGHVAEGTWAANGSNEVIQQLLQAFGGPGRTALGFEPSYSMHRLIALGTGTAWAAEQRAGDFTIRNAAEAVARHAPDVTFLCSPNNPTGTAIPASVVAEVYDATAGMVVVDEAYAEFSHAPSAVALLPGRPRLVVTRTMSKAFALAGARVGYLAADPAVVDALRLVRLPYHLSALTQAAARVALRHRDVLLRDVETLKSERDRLVEALPVTVPSDANFVLFGAAEGTWQALLDRGVLVRDVGLLGWLRVTAGRPEENDAFLDALREVTR